MAKVEITNLSTNQFLSLNSSIYKGISCFTWISAIHKRIVSKIFEYNIVISLCQYETNTQVPFIHLI